ncbi:MAG: hypothetical protein ACLS4Z_05755 [Christensenellaceae bacterium]
MRFSDRFRRNGQHARHLFSQKGHSGKIRELKVGDWVVLSGANEAFNGSVSYTAKKINYGTAPENFVPEPRKGKPVPAVYRTVFPEPYVDYTQAGFFDRLEKPDDLKNNTFVVFDLETTGLNNQPSMGKMDDHRNRRGEARQRRRRGKVFSFVACPDRLSRNNQSDGNPRRGSRRRAAHRQGSARFYKFCDGCSSWGTTYSSTIVSSVITARKIAICSTRSSDTLTLAHELLRES